MSWLSHLLGMDVVACKMEAIASKLEVLIASQQAGSDRMIVLENRLDEDKRLQINWMATQLRMAPVYPELAAQTAHTVHTRQTTPSLQKVEEALVAATGDSNAMDDFLQKTMEVIQESQDLDIQ